VPPPSPAAETAGAGGRSAPGGTELAATGSRESEFRQLGAAALAEDLASFPFGSGEDSERAAFMEKARRGMAAGFLRGHTVCGLTVSAMDVAVLILTQWGEQGGVHPDVSSLPLGLRDLVLSWVMLHRR